MPAAPLRKILEDAYAVPGKRMNKSIAGVRLEQFSRGPEHEKAYQNLQEKLSNAVRLTHRGV